MLKHILVPLDRSNRAEQALDYAIELARATNGKLTLVHVLEEPDLLAAGTPPPVMTTMPMGGGAIPVTTPNQQKAVEKNYLREAEAYMQGVSGKLETAGITVNTVIQSGNPAEEIVNIAQTHNADAIAMATEGHSGLGRLLFGSVMQDVLKSTPCPVLVIPKNDVMPDQDA